MPTLTPEHLLVNMCDLEGSKEIKRLVKLHSETEMKDWVCSLLLLLGLIRTKVK